MKVSIFLKGRKEPITYMGDKIDVIDLNLNGINYKQVRYFKNGTSKSELILKELIIKIIEL
ncbi:hypothetical protein ACH36K_10860 [Clostridium sp. MB05]|jgi:hypothetical protein|uniref:Uncharacterized protein n=1 Tax=Clostridium perfringens TaxID=1502 RepID=A0AAW9KGU1_CLOPF|nr:hypothetical protein [Clostridium perfringens]